MPDFMDRIKITNELSLYLNELGIPSVKVELYSNWITIYVQKIDEINSSKVIASKNSISILESWKI